MLVIGLQKHLLLNPNEMDTIARSRWALGANNEMMDKSHPRWHMRAHVQAVIICTEPLFYLHSSCTDEKL